MEETKINYIPVGQAKNMKDINDRTFRFNKFIKINKMKLIICAIAIILVSTDVILLKSFVKYMIILETFI